MDAPTSKRPRFMLLRFLFRSAWFRRLALAAILLPICLVLVVLKIWTTSPSWVTPKIKVSVVDFVQASALKRTALKAEKNGQRDRALYSWRLAVANNPGGPDLNRGMLRCIMSSPNRNEHMALAIQQSLWLLKITGTNTTDLELTTQLLQAEELDTMVVGLLKPVENRLSPVLAKTYLKSLFITGQADDFARVSKQVGASSTSDSELQLYQAAHEAGWGTSGQNAEGWRKLDQGASAFPALSSQLAMMASFKARDVLRYEKAFAAATNLHSARLIDNINRWRLYASITNQPKAKQLATAFTGSCSNAVECMMLAQTHVQLGLPEKALKVLQAGVTDFGSIPLWLLYADLLTAQRDWDNLLGLANQMRQDRRVSRQLTGQSYFIEGLAEAARQHRTQGEAAMLRVSEFELPSPGAAVAMGKAMLELGFSAPAKRLLLKHQNTFKAEPAYWNLVYYSAAGSKDESLLLSASKEMYSLASTNWQAQYAYAAALLTARVEPAQAVKLTQEVLKHQPANVGAKINHSLALAQNQLPSEAQAALKEIDRTKLNPLQSNAVAQAEFEIYLALKDYEKARAVSAQIQKTTLFPSEAKWFEDALKQIRPVKKPGTPS